MTHTITLAKAREIAKSLRDRRVSAKVADVRDWPIGTLRDALLWFRLIDAGPRPVLGFQAFIESRSHLRRCRGCGCTENNACVDPRFDVPCSWIERDLCSACVGRRQR